MSKKPKPSAPLAPKTLTYCCAICGDQHSDVRPVKPVSETDRRLAHADCRARELATAPAIDTPEKLADVLDTGALPKTCTTCGWPVGAGQTCEVDGTVAA